MKERICVALKGMFLYCIIINPNTIISGIEKSFPFITPKIKQVTENEIVITLEFGLLDEKEIMFDCVFSLKKSGDKSIIHQISWK